MNRVDYKNSDTDSVLEKMQVVVSDNIVINPRTFIRHHMVER